MSARAVALGVFETEIDALIAVKESLNQTFDQAVDLIVETLSARGKIVVVGIGKSGNVGIKIAATLSSTGAPSVVLNAVDALHGDLGIVADGDLILALSYSGETEELVGLLPGLKRAVTKLVTITGNAESSLGRASNVVLDVQVPAEACPFNLAPTSSATATMVMGDALAMAVLERRGFNEQDFAERHPSGAIGRALLLKVKDIMRGERNPVASGSITVREALMVMTRAKSGCVCVVDSGGRLVGIFTDGDLRRAMTNHEDILNVSLTEVMTRDPVSIEESSLAVEALRIFDERRIDDLVAVDSNLRPVGLIDSQDLPKLKLM